MKKLFFIFALGSLSLSLDIFSMSKQELYESEMNKLDKEEQEIIQEFCTLRNMEFKDFMKPTDEILDEIKQQVYRTWNNRAHEVEDILDQAQKKEIKSIFGGKGIHLNNTDIIQYKKEYDNGTATISLLSCKDYYKVITCRKFWLGSLERRTVAIRNVLSHAVHEDCVKRELMGGFWEFIKEERSKDQALFEHIYNKFLKFEEKRADIEALALSNIDEACHFIEQLRKDASTSPNYPIDPSFHERVEYGLDFLTRWNNLLLSNGLGLE